MRKGLFLFADYYDATTTTIRVLRASEGLFDEIEFLYWARLGKERNSKDKIFDGIKLEAYAKTAKPRSLGVLLLSVQFQFWLFKNLFKRKPNFVVAFSFFTIAPALMYKFFFNWKCKVIYDPRDYVSVSFRINNLVSFMINLLDNIFMKMSDFVIFPDRQYFIYYGKFKLSEDKYLILPNSTEDCYIQTLSINIFEKYNLPKDKKLIPVLGYFSETRGEKILFDLIKEKHQELHFVFAGDIRDEMHLNFFKEYSETVTFLGKIPYLDALTIMKESLIVPLLYDPQLLNNTYGTATKYYDSLMVGSPMVVCDGLVNMKNEIELNGFGWSVNYYDTPTLKNIIFNYINEPNLVNKESLRDFFLDNYDYAIYKPKLREVYSKFIS